MWDGVERRKGADWVDISINVFNIAAWVVFVVALVIFHYARPELEYMYYQFVAEQVHVRTHWQYELKSWLLVALYICTAISVLTLIINKFRLKRKSDRQRYGMYMLVIVCVVFISVVTVRS
ncbi:MAG: hypothetical protein HWE10_06110 [Gammaproteobacteria bacterium]|nr:hypothetical protein [Gammaproteobacteria bacterium]